MKKCNENKHIYYMVLAVLIICQLVYTTCIFADRQIFHSDEIWSYGLANSYYKPFIYGQDGIFIEKITQDEFTNANEWVSAEIFNDYITVQEGQQFAYDSVYHNQTLDHHPPLFYILLHTICSFFPNYFSLWYGYFLSAIFLVFTQIFLFKLTEKVTESRLVALLTCALYGVGNGAVLTFTFIRQYSLLTMLCVIYTYFGACLYEDYRAEKPCRRHLVGAVLTAFCAFMTHYYAIIYIGMFTACFCLWLLLNRKWKKMLQLGFSMAVTLGVFFLLYPAALSQTFEGEAKKVTGLSFMVQYRGFLNYIFRYNLGFSVDIWGNMFFQLAWPCALFLLCCLVLLYIPFRREVWMQRLFVWLRGLPGKTLTWLKRIHWFPFFVLAGVLVQCVAVNITVSLMKMGIYSMRYVFMDFPLVCLVAVVFVRWVLKAVLGRRFSKFVLPALTLVVTIAIISSKLQSLPSFETITPGKPQEMAEQFRNKNCVFIVKSPQYYWLTTSASIYLRYADRVYLTWGEWFAEEEKVYNAEEVASDYVIVDADYLELTDSEQELVEKWLEGESTLSVDEENSNMEMNEDVDETTKIMLNDRIRSLNGGCDYAVTGLICLNGQVMYVLALE